jgi:hypothetical protein
MFSVPTAFAIIDFVTLQFSIGTPDRPVPSTSVDRRLFLLRESRCSSVDIATSYVLDDRGLKVRFSAGVGIILFFTASIPALEPTQTPIQWEPAALSPRDKAAGA